ncbi:MAG TPA: serine/threonine-protein kinase [Acidobacteriota bacterium]|nr:serine/threonine-protein kinase [Acidobacteriota bacterium]
MEERFIGSYKVLRPVGAGGMAKVYLAVHKDVPNLVVILKILSDPRLVARFKQEADKLALLDGHPNVCRIKHFFSHGEDTVIAMEYIDGVALDDLLSQHGRLPVAEAVRIMVEVLDTLEFAHQKGIYHRDIKPSNIMVDKNGRVKVIDFGIAKGKADPNLTIAGTACGTAAYMAPEQFSSSEDTNYALADIYAVGTTLFCMLCGELPFKGENEFAIRDAKLFTDPPEPRSICRDIPLGLQNAVLKSISREPEDRFQSAEEMKAAIATTAVPRAEPEPGPTQSIPVAAVRKKRKVLPIVAAAAALAIAAVAIYVLIPRAGVPEIPQLYSPAERAVVAHAAPLTFTWSAVAGAGGTYFLDLATDSSFTDALQITDWPDTVHSGEAKLPSGEYFWRVRAVSEDGRAGGYSSGRSFTIASPPAPATGTLQITVNRRSDVYVNDSLRVRDATRWEATTDTGLYGLRIENTSSTEGEIVDTVSVAAGDTVSRSYAFTFPEPKPPPVANGELAVLSFPPGAVIFVDGVKKEDVHTPYTLTLRPGERRIKAILDDEEMPSLELSVNVAAGQYEKMMFDFDGDSVIFPYTD